VENRGKRPVWLQAQPEQGVGFIVQKKVVKVIQVSTATRPGVVSSNVLSPISENPGSEEIRLEAGNSVDFDYSTGDPPFAFRIGILYSTTRAQTGGDWNLAWSGWLEHRGRSKVDEVPTQPAE
jgi:hypothetical protein